MFFRKKIEGIFLLENLAKGFPFPILSSLYTNSVRREGGKEEGEGGERQGLRLRQRGEGESQCWGNEREGEGRIVTNIF